MSAATLIAAKGQPMTLTYHAVGGYDPATSTATVTDTTVTTTGVVFPLSRGLKHMPGSNIGIDDQQLLLPGDITQPPIDTTVTFGGKSYLILEVAPLAPAGEALIFDCMIRGAP